ncbi:MULTISPECIES: hypothetical protein [Novosphingobium]|uniref:Uncharacterized protein n=1 Tax=Novosphingobium aerophilum TaxID=2839843 RepID=A0A7X1KBX0_9SPHN|nr:MULTISPECIES: hypothetical protein [Novosphingobium]MBC2651694.1 hypothetical protein [Novosphingobium aerophilum]
MLGCAAAGDPWPGGEVVPGGYAPVMIADREKGRHLVPRMWGVPPPRGDYLVPFARNLDSPFWVGVLRHTGFRCIVPMTGIRRGRDWWVPPGNAISACAGIWRDTEIPSFAILTSGGADGQPGGLPVALGPRACDLWLRADIREARVLVEEASAGFLAP